LQSVEKKVIIIKDKMTNGKEWGNPLFHLCYSKL
jgi:hypothetical protein